MTAMLISAILTGNVKSFRIMLGTLDTAAIIELTRAIIKIADAMPLDQYVKYDMESKIIEMQYISTL
jgi:hypothetical protein